MSEYTISQVCPTDKTVLAQIDTLLSQEGIRRDGNLDYICAMFDEEYNVIGTGSCFGNTLRCFAVSSAHEGEGLLNRSSPTSSRCSVRGGICTCFSTPR